MHAAEKQRKEEAGKDKSRDYSGASAIESDIVTQEGFSRAWAGRSKEFDGEGGATRPGGEGKGDSRCGVKRAAGGTMAGSALHSSAKKERDKGRERGSDIHKRAREKEARVLAGREKEMEKWEGMRSEGRGRDLSPERRNALRLAYVGTFRSRFVPVFICEVFICVCQ